MQGTQHPAPEVYCKNAIASRGAKGGSSGASGFTAVMSS